MSLNFQEIVPFLFIFPYIYLSFKDMKSMEIPAGFSWGVLACSIIYAVSTFFLGEFYRNLGISLILGGFLGGLMIFILWIASRKKGIGEGDILVVASMGFLLGTGRLLVLLEISALLGLMVGVYSYVRFRKFKGVAIPYIPLLTVAYIISYSFGSALLQYFLGTNLK